MEHCNLSRIIKYVLKLIIDTIGTCHIDRLPAILSIDCLVDPSCGNGEVLGKGRARHQFAGDSINQLLRHRYSFFMPALDATKE